MVTSTGEVWVWGNGAQGRLGLSDNTPRHTPTKVEGLPDMVSLSCGSIHTVTMTVKGGVMAWGGGIGSTPKPLSIGQKVSSLSCFDSATLLLTQSGDLLICQDHSQLPHFQILVEGRETKNGKEIIGASVGVDHVVAITSDGSVLMWTSYPHYTQTSQQARPVELELPNGKQRGVFVACGAAHTLVIVSQPHSGTDRNSVIGLAVSNNYNNTVNNNNNSGNDETAEEVVFSDATTQQAIARLRSKLSVTSNRASSPLTQSSQPQPFSHNASLATLSSRISALGNIHPRKSEDNPSTNQHVKRSTITQPPSFSWKTSSGSRRPSDLDSDDVGLPSQTKLKKQNSIFSSTDTTQDENENEKSKRQSLRGLYDHLRDSLDASAIANESRLNTSVKLDEPPSNDLSLHKFTYGRSGLQVIMTFFFGR